MHVGADQALTVVNKNRVAIEEIVARIGHHTSRWRLDGSTSTHRHIKPGMRVARQAVEDAAQAEARREWASGRQQESRIRRSGGKLPLDRLGDFFFTRNARKIVRIWLDLALVLDRQALLRVILDLDDHFSDCCGRRPGNADFQFAGQGIERNAEQGKPVAIFAHHGERQIAPLGAGSRRTVRAKIKHDNTTGHRRLPR